MYDDIIWIYSFSGTYLLPKIKRKPREGGLSEPRARLVEVEIWNGGNSALKGHLSVKVV